MMIVQDSEWILTEVGDDRFTFVNRKDDTVNMTVQRCRYILKEYDYALNLSFDDGVPGLEFTTKTERRLAPSKVRTELHNVLTMLKQNCVRNAERLSH